MRIRWLCYPILYMYNIMLVQIAAVWFQVLSVGSLRPANVYYSYVVPLAGDVSFRWFVNDSWTDCDRECSGESHKLTQQSTIILLYDYNSLLSYYNNMTTTLYYHTTLWLQHCTIILLYDYNTLLSYYCYATAATTIILQYAYATAAAATNYCYY